MRPTRTARASTLLTLMALMMGLIAPALTLGQEPAPDAAQEADLIADSWIVMLAPGGDAAADAPGLALAAGGEVGHVYQHALSGFQLRGSAAAAQALRNNPRVLSVEPDRAIELTETLPFGVKRISAYLIDGVGAYQAGFRGAGARIAVLDTGIDLDHPDLEASIDGALGRNCVDETLSPNDVYGHGTHVAGTAAAPRNNIGVVGVAPEARLVAVKMFDDAGTSSETRALCALDHITGLNLDADPGNDIDVANMSWGEERASAWGTCLTDPLHAAICGASAANITLVAGAGNSMANAGNFVPGAFPEVIGVSALEDYDGLPGGLRGCVFFVFQCDDTMADFSNYGPSVDVIAPGQNVNSTWPGGTYSTSSGTSMATPHVAGVVALMAAVDPSLTPARAIEVLRLTGECPNGQAADADGSAGCEGQGLWGDDPDGIPEVLPHALRAAQAMGEPPPPPPPGDPTAPGAPTLTSATGAVDSVTLAWAPPASDGGSPITGYEVWRGPASDSVTILATVGVEDSYVDSTVETGQTYWYQVAAVNVIGTGPLSNGLTAGPTEPVVPAPAPTLLGAAADGAAILSWTIPADDGGSPISGYEIYRSVAGGPEALLASTTGTTHLDFGLTNGTTYTYRVAAVNGAGIGAFSNAVTVTPTAEPTAPEAPLNLTGTKAKGAANAIDLAWSAPLDDGGSPIATYFVYRRGPTETSFTLIGNPDGTTTTFRDSTVERRTTYTYYVTAWNAYGPSPPSNEVTVRSK